MQIIRNSQQPLREVQKLRDDDGDSGGWSPRLRRRFGYFTPDEWYEATLLRLIDKGAEWLDVGCGSDLFPFNEPLAKLLSSRCHFLVGLDPSDNIDENVYVHERAKCLLEQYSSDRQFNLISLRMVAEHIAEPATAIAALGRLIKPGGAVIIYTVSKWSPVSLVAAATPMWAHHFVKGLLWGGSPEDTFPTIFAMNTRHELLKLFEAEGFVEEDFLYLDDCRSFARWRLGAILELSLWRVLRAVGLHYPEICILGIYRKAERK